MNDLTLLIIIASIFTVIGFIVGRVMSDIRSRPGASEDRDEKDDPDLVEVVRVWYLKSKKILIPEIDGKKYYSKEDLTPRQRSRLIQLLNKMKAMLAPAIEKSDVSEKTRENQPSPATLPADRTTTEKPHIDPMEVIRSAVKADVTDSASQPQSIPAQIDEILQKKLSGTSMGKKAIRLMEFPEKGMVVMVGLEKYDRVDEVPDEEVRELIQDAVAEWEAQQGER